MKLYLTGGAVRNHMLGLPTKDYDFAVEASSFEEMRGWLVGRGVHVWQERPEFVTIRGKLPRYELGDFDGLLPDVPRSRQIDADFTMCRAETMYSDRRHPDVVTPADIRTDLSRRDFTVNAVAVSEDGLWLDPYDGQRDAEVRMLVCVGDPRERFEEDPLRILRAIRFSVVYGLEMNNDIRSWLRSQWLCNLLSYVPVERVREELAKSFRHDWQMTMMTLAHEVPQVGLSLFRMHPRLWLKPTTEDR